MWLIALGNTAMAGVTVTREPTRAETTPPVEIPADAKAIKASKLYSDEFRRKLERATLRGLDNAVRWQTSAIVGCGPGDVTITLAFAGDGHVKKVTPAHDADPALAACVTTAFADAWLPVMRTLPSATWTFHVDGAQEAAVPAMDRDRGLNLLNFGDTDTAVEGLESTSSEGGVSWYEALTDSSAERYFGAPHNGILYGFCPDGFCITTVRLVGDASTFGVRRGLNSRYGASKTDVNGHVYWRGKTMVYELIPGEGDMMVLAILDIERATRAGLVDRLPGDKSDSAKPPRYLRKD